jgi:hypothetical protein
LSLVLIPDVDLFAFFQEDEDEDDGGYGYRRRGRGGAGLPADLTPFHEGKGFCSILAWSHGCSSSATVFATGRGNMQDIVRRVHFFFFYVSKVRFLVRVLIDFWM